MGLANVNPCLTCHWRGLKSHFLHNREVVLEQRFPQIVVPCHIVRHSLKSVLSPLWRFLKADEFLQWAALAEALSLNPRQPLVKRPSMHSTLVGPLWLK
jgi:hypothetical protein